MRVLLESQLGWAIRHPKDALCWQNRELLEPGAGAETETTEKFATRRRTGPLERRVTIFSVVSRSGGTGGRDPGSTSGSKVSHNAIDRAVCRQ